MWQSHGNQPTPSATMLDFALVVLPTKSAMDLHHLRIIGYTASYTEATEIA